MKTSDLVSREQHEAFRQGVAYGQRQTEKRGAFAVQCNPSMGGVARKINSILGERSGRRVESITSVAVTKIGGIEMETVIVFECDLDDGFGEVKS